MYKTIKYFAAAGAVAGLLFGAFALAQQNWAPPAEIAPKAPDGAPAAGAAPAAAPAAAVPMSKAEKEKSCADQAAAKGLKGKAKKQFRAECVRQ